MVVTNHTVSGAGETEKHEGLGGRFYVNRGVGPTDKSPLLADVIGDDERPDGYNALSPSREAMPVIGVFSPAPLVVVVEPMACPNCGTGVEDVGLCLRCWDAECETARYREERERDASRLNGYKRNYRERHKEEIASRRREYYLHNRERLIAYQRDYRARNRPTVLCEMEGE